MALDCGYDFQGAQGLNYKFQGLIRSNLPIPRDVQTGRPARSGPSPVKPGPFWARPARHD
jgi:hypothetical protein